MSTIAIVSRLFAWLATAAVMSLGLLGCGGSDDSSPPNGSASGEPQSATTTAAESIVSHAQLATIPKRQVVPAKVAHRIAAAWSPRNAYLPTRAPKGLSFLHWKLIANGNTADQLAVDLGAPGVRWQVSFPRILEERYGITCEKHRSGGSGRSPVFFTQTEAGNESAWTCIGTGTGQLAVSASQRSADPDARPPKQFVAMVASARRGASGRAPGLDFELVPAAQARDVSREFGPDLYLPTALPPGFIFTNWKVVRHTPYDGRRWAIVSFGRNGVHLNWSVYRGVEKYAVSCPHGHPYRADLKDSSLINGRTILFGDGIHGADAWECVPAQAGENAEPLELDLWYDIRLDNPAMRRLAKRIVASSRLVAAQ